MARPKSPYSIRKQKRRVGGQLRESTRWNIFFKDHRGIERRLPATSDRSESEYMAQQVNKIVALRGSNQPLPVDLRDYIDARPKDFRPKLADWGILDASSNASFEPLMEYKKGKGPSLKVSTLRRHGWTRIRLAKELGGKRTKPPTHLSGCHTNLHHYRGMWL